MRASNYQEPGYEFGYTPFEELPLMRVTMIEEVLVNEIQSDQSLGLLMIKHNDPIAKDIEIELPLTNSKMKELQEQDPLVGHLRKQWAEKKLNKKHFTMEDEVLKKKTVINGILYTPTVIPDVLKDFPLNTSTRQTGTQWFQKNIQLTKTHVPLEGHEKNNSKTLYYMQHMCKTQHKGATDSKGTLQGTHPTNGIHCNGSDRRVPPPTPPAKETGMHSRQYAG